jgi:hypothetical protein
MLSIIKTVMKADKSWITPRNQNDLVFIKGRQNFKTAKKVLDSEGKIYCLCRKCANAYWHIPSLVSAHIRDRGFLQAYDTWVYHREEYANASDIDTLWASKRSAPVADREMV